MSSIAQYLQSIRNAILARTVRNDIANAIEQCYDDVHNPTLNTEAIQAAVQAKIDAGQMAALTIADGSLTGAKLANGTIPTAKIADGAVTAGKIASGIIPAIDATLTQSGSAADAKKTGDEISELKADLGAQTGVISLIKNYYIKTSDTPIDLTPMPSSVGRMYAVVDCTVGDKFVINAYSDSTASVTWCFIDSANNAISMAEPQVAVTDLELTAPTNAVKLIINDQSGGISYKVGNNLVSRVSEIEEGGAGLPDSVKAALLNCFDGIAWAGKSGRTKYSALAQALGESTAVRYHWNSQTDSGIVKVLLDLITDGGTYNGTGTGIIKENGIRACCVLNTGEYGILSSPSMTDSGYCFVPIPDDATRFVISTSEDYEIATQQRRYDGVKYIYNWVGANTGWSTYYADVVITHQTNGRANCIAINIRNKNSPNAHVLATPVIDIQFFKDTNDSDPLNAYDVDGNPLTANGSKMRVCAFNVGHFDYGHSKNPAGTNEMYEQFIDFFKESNADVYMFSEWSAQWNKANNVAINDVLGDFRPYHTQTYDVDSWVGQMIYSVYPLASENIERFSDGRYFVDNTIRFADKIIHFICTHLHNTTHSIRAEQIAQILDYIDDNNIEYYIIGGDLNLGQDGPATRESIINITRQELTQLTSKGAKSVQGSCWGGLDVYGLIDTVTRGKDDPDNYWHGILMPFDNIAVSPNIIVRNAYVLIAPASDHDALIADVEIM